MCLRGISAGFLIIQAGWLLLGCARLPPAVGISDAEGEAVIASFQNWTSEVTSCPGTLDAAAAVTFKSWVQSGTLAGYVQAMAPAYLKVIAVNPLGQPMLALAADGERFRYLSVPEKKAYEGSVLARAFAKYAPAGAQPEQAFYWLSGRMPPEPFEILGVARDEAGAGYWLDLAGSMPLLRHRVLYDPGEGGLRRHLVVDGKRGALVDVRYGGFLAPDPATPSCRWPSEITVEAREHPGKMLISLNEFLPDPRLERRDFSLEAPAGFERIIVQ